MPSSPRRPLTVAAVPLLAVVSAVALVALVPVARASAVATRVAVAHGLAAPPHAVAVAVPATSTFDVSLTPTDAAGLARFVSAVTTPGTAQYRHYLTESQYVARYAPAWSTVDAVESYFRGAGLTVSYDRASPLLLHVRGPSTDVARAFATTLRAARVDSAVSTEFAGAATLPTSVAGAVTAIDGLTSLTPPLEPSLARVRHAGAHAAARITEPGTCGAAVSLQSGAGFGSYLPDQQAAAYGIANEWAQGINGAGQSIAVFELANYVAADVHTYFHCFGLSPTITNVNVDGGPTGTDDSGGTSGPEGEADLDVEEAGVLAPGASLIVYQGTQNVDTGILDTYQAIATADKASVVTTSWGGCEVEETSTSDMTAENAVFEQMAAQGQSVFAAAGDAGSSDCWTGGSSDRQLAVDDPASQPLVTGVGGLTVTSVSPLRESVWDEPNTAGGGGGDSRVWPQPTWQTGDDVPTTNTRMVPDLSVMADPDTGFIDFVGDNWGTIGGTSIGAPILAAVTATADQACGVRVGDINPTIYEMAADGTGFDDVKSGTNALFASTRGDYDAGVGYDRASGLGSPDPATFIPGLCTTIASATTSTVAVDPTTSADVATGARVTVTVREADDDVVPNATVTVTGLETGGTVKVTPIGVTTNASGQQSFDVDATAPGAVTLSVSVGPTALTAPPITFTSSLAATSTDLTGLNAAPGQLASSWEGTSTLFGAAVTASHALTQASTTTNAFNDSSRFRLATVDGAPATDCAGTACVIAVDVRGQLALVTNAASTIPRYTSLASRSILARELAADSLSVVATPGGGGAVTFRTTSDQLVIATWRASAATATFRNLSTTLHLARASGGTSVVETTPSEFYVAVRIGADVRLVRSGTTTGDEDLATATGYVDTGSAALVDTPDLARDAESNELEVLARTDGGGLVVFTATAHAPATITSVQSLATSGVTAAQFVIGSTSAQSSTDDVLALFGARAMLIVDAPTWTSLNVSSLTDTTLVARSLSIGTAPLVVTATTVESVSP